MKYYESLSNFKNERRKIEFITKWKFIYIFIKDNNPIDTHFKEDDINDAEYPEYLIKIKWGKLMLRNGLKKNK